MEQLTDAMIVCPDQPTANYLKAVMGCDSLCTVLLDKRGIENRIDEWRQRGRHRVLILVPSNRTHEFAIEQTRHVASEDGLTLVWVKESHYRDEQWILMQLLRAEGALICETLDVLTEIAHIFSNTEGAHFTDIQTAKANSAIMSHVVDAANKVMRDTRAKAVPALKMNKSSHIVLEWEKKKIPLHSAPGVIGEALTDLCMRARQNIAAVTPPKISANNGIIEMIARPPARILSETTSKRLLGAFGLRTPTETLCESPSQAVRCAKLLNGPATLKLVRPNFRFKSDAGAVIQDVSGPSDIQKAYQSLITLSESMGNPKALGILVCEQVESKQLFWMDARRHSRFGRILFIGRRDEINESADAALAATCTIQQCYTTIVNTYPQLSPFESTQLADAVFRFAFMCKTLGEHVGLAQIHPLALTAEGPLMLDALVGITDINRTEKNL